MTSPDLVDKKLVITGAARGIGRALTLALSEAGATVAAIDKNVDGVRETIELAGQTGAGGLAIGCDLSAEDDVVATVRSIVEQFGRLDGVVANAGGADGERTPFLELDATAWRRMVDRNLTATFLTGLHCGRVMAGQGNGSIVFMASIAATVVQPGLAHYAAAKAGVSQLARGMAAELGPSGVRVNSVAAGSIVTDGNRALMERTPAGEQWAAKTALGRLGRDHDILGAVAYLLSDRAAYTTGATIVVDGGFSLL